MQDTARGTQGLRVAVALLGLLVLVLAYFAFFAHKHLVATINPTGRISLRAAKGDTITFEVADPEAQKGKSYSYVLYPQGTNVLPCEKSKSEFTVTSDQSFPCELTGPGFSLDGSGDGAKSVFSVVSCRGCMSVDGGGGAGKGAGDGNGAGETGDARGPHPTDDIHDGGYIPISCSGSTINSTLLATIKTNAFYWRGATGVDWTVTDFKGAGGTPAGYVCTGDDGKPATSWNSHYSACNNPQPGNYTYTIKACGSAVSTFKMVIPVPPPGVPTLVAPMPTPPPMEAGESVRPCKGC